MTKELSVTNLYGIRGTITHSTDSNVLVIAGESGNGKSSFVRGFPHLFAHKSVKGAPNPIHHGQVEAEVAFTDHEDGLRYSRKWKNGKMSPLEIRVGDGAKYANPGEMLAGKIGTIKVDVSAYLSSDEKVRREEILAKSTFPEGVDLNELSQAQVAAESRRTDSNREMKRLEGVMSALVPPAKSTPDEEQSAAELIGQIQEGRERESRRLQLIESRRIANAEIVEIQKQIAALQAMLTEKEAALTAINFDPLVSAEPVDVSPLEAKLAGIEDTNRAVREKKTYLATKADYDAAVAAAKKESDAVEAAKAAKFNALKSAEFPHPSLSVDDDFVLVDDTAWPDVNDGMKSLIALAVAISGEHEEDALKLVILKEGDWMDAKTLAAASDMLAEKGFFGLVDRGRPDMPDVVGIDVIELIDGQLA